MSLQLKDGQGCAECSRREDVQLKALQKPSRARLERPSSKTWSARRRGGGSSLSLLPPQSSTHHVNSMVGSIPRTAVPIWSPTALPSPTPLLATGTVSGALDASFSSDSLLELWDPFHQPTAEYSDVQAELSPVASLSVGSRFNRLAWGYIHPTDRPQGVIAAGLENGEISLWDPQVMLNKDTTQE